MIDTLLVIPLFLWLFTYGIISFFHRMIKKRVGVQSETYADSKFPIFILNLLNSIASVGLMLYIMNRPVASEAVAYIAVPYFGIIAYYVTSAFRTLKDARNS